MIATTEDEVRGRSSAILASFEDTTLEMALGVCGCVVTNLLEAVPQDMRFVLARSWFLAVLNDAHAHDYSDTRH